MVHDFLIPETTLLLIQDDLQISRPASIRTLRQSRVFGTMMHSSDKESSAVLDVWRRTTNESHHNEALFLQWIQAKSNEDFVSWVRIQEAESVSIKQEQLETTVRRAASKVAEIIDLTLDDD